MNALLITGTETQSGKTLLANGLAAYWQRYCPTRSLGQLTIAPQPGEQQVNLEACWQKFETLLQVHDWVIVDSVGGLGSPITRETTVADLAWDWRIPTVMMVPITPNSMTQAVAHSALAQQTRVHLKAIVLNCVQSCPRQQLEDWVDVRLLQSLTHKPILGTLPHLSDPTDTDKLIQVIANLEIDRLISIF